MIMPFILKDIPDIGRVALWYINYNIIILYREILACNLNASKIKPRGSNFGRFARLVRQGTERKKKRRGNWNFMLLLCFIEIQEQVEGHWRSFILMCSLATKTIIN